MFEKFESFFCRDIDGKPVKPVTNRWEQCGAGEGFDAFMAQFNSQSFRGGLYRLLGSQEIDVWRCRIAVAYPSFKNRIIPFGYDWLGRFFCLDLDRVASGGAQVLFFNMITDEVLEVPAGGVEFHESLLIEMIEPALELSKFSDFLKINNIREIGFNECAELVVPLYLGGKFEPLNMKVGDLALYWDLSSQIVLQSRGMKLGDKVTDVLISPGH
jgi:hypothetical protein